jgi:hypothetical protein
MQTIAPSKPRCADDDRDFATNSVPRRPHAVALVTAHDTGNRIPVVGDDNDHLK